MKKSIAFLLLVFSILNVWSQPRPVKLSSTIVIDTDCGIDDMCAISILLARPEITVKAILTSNGSLSPKEGAEKVLSLLNEFDKNGIPVNNEIKMPINNGNYQNTRFLHQLPIIHPQNILSFLIDHRSQKPYC